MELQPEAVSCGVDSLQFWSMTPRDIRAAIQGYSKKQKAEIEAKFELNGFYAWLQGKYNAFAHHDPKHYPERPWTAKEEPIPEMTDEAMETWAKSWAMQMSKDVI